MYTITHFLPGIGSSILAADELKLKSEYAFSYDMEKLIDHRDEIFKLNFPHIQLQNIDNNLHTDVGDDDFYSLKGYQDYIKANKILPTNIVFSIPPCSGLTGQNPWIKKKLGNYEKHNNFIYDSVKFFLAQKSDILILENSHQLFYEDKKPMIQHIVDIITHNKLDKEYRIHLILIKSNHVGIPQTKSRAFVCIYRKPAFIEYELPKQNFDYSKFLKRPFERDLNGIHYSWANRTELLAEWEQWLAKDELAQETKANHKLKKANKPYRFLFTMFDKKNHVFIPEVIARFNGYPLIKEKMEEIIGEHKGGLVYNKYPIFINQLFVSVCGKHSRYVVHPDYDRFLTLQEFADLQFLPDTFKFLRHEDFFGTMRIISRFIPTIMIKEVLNYAIKVLESNPTKSDSNILYYQNTRL